MKQFLTFATCFLLALTGVSAQKAFLGVNSDEVSRSKARAMNFDNPHGVIIDKVVKNTAADRAGLQPADYLYRIGNNEFDSNYGLTEALAEFRSGDRSVLYIVRKGKNYSKDVTFGSYADRGHDYTTDRNRTPFLGVSSTHNNGRSDVAGVAVDITNGSTAEAVGMRNGDILTHIDDYRIVDWGDISNALRNIDVGDDITVRYVRNGESMKGSSTINTRENRNSSFHSSDFEDRMERFGEKMERLGERIGEKAEHWAENAERWVDENEDEIEARAESFGREIEETVESIFNDEGEYERRNRSTGEKAFIGIYSDRISSDKASYLGFDNRYGSYITGIVDNTAADEGGLKPFDYIYGIDQYRVGKEQSLGTILHKYRAGDDAEIVYLRNNKKQTGQITFAPRSQARYTNVSDCDEPFLGISKTHDSRNGYITIRPLNNTTAKEMGLEEGDAIKEINGYPIYDWSDISTAIDMMKPGETIRLVVDRAGKQKNFSAVVKARREMRDCDDHNDNDNDDDKDTDNNFDFDWDSDEVIVSRGGSPSNPVDISDMEVKVEVMPSEDADEMRQKYGVDMPVISNLEVAQIEVFPNPSVGMFMLKFDLPQKGDTAVRIFNALGREIYNYELDNFSGTFEDSIDISQNGAGSYYLAVTQNGRTMTKKIILQRR